MRKKPALHDAPVTATRQHQISQSALRDSSFLTLKPQSLPIRTKPVRIRANQSTEDAIITAQQLYFLRKCCTFSRLLGPPRGLEPWASSSYTVCLGRDVSFLWFLVTSASTLSRPGRVRTRLLVMRSSQLIPRTVHS